MMCYGHNVLPIFMFSSESHLILNTNTDERELFTFYMETATV